MMSLRSSSIVSPKRGYRIAEEGNFDIALPLRYRRLAK